jgi:tyrosine-protein kinase Etk/Wzc
MTAKKKSSIIEFDDISALFKILSKNWYILVIALALSGAISYFYTYKLTDIYAAKSQILLKNDETYDYQNQIYKGIGYYQSYQDNSNQIRVITSNDLIAESLTKLNLDVSYYIVGRLKTTEVYQAVPFEVQVNTISPFLYEKEIKFNFVDENQFQLTYAKGEQSVTKTFPFDKPIEDPDLFITVKKNDIINKNSIAGLKETEYVVKIHNNESLVSTIKNNLAVEPIEGTTILELTLQDEIPARAITFLDTLSLVYINYTAKSQIVINTNTLDNIDKQLKEITEILGNIEDDMEHYKSDKAVLDLDKQEENYFEKLIGFDSQKRQVELWIQALEALQKYIVSVGKL